MSKKSRAKVTASAKASKKTAANSGAAKRRPVEPRRVENINQALEVIREELQASNEELLTLNELLENRNVELTQLSTDLGNVLSGVDIPIVLVDAERKVGRFTASAGTRLGLVARDIGKPIGRLRILINVPDLDQLISHAIDKSEEAAREVQSKTGRWYSLCVRPFPGGGDKAQGVLLTFVDIDELKKAQQAASERAEQSESSAQALFESAPQAIVALNAEGEIRLVNDSAEKMFGYKRDVLIGRKLESLLPERDRAGHARKRAAWFAHPQKRPTGTGLEWAGLRADGAEFPIEVSLSFIPARNATLGVAFVSDITARRNSERALAEYNDHLTAEVDALHRLRRTNDELWRSHDLKAGLHQMLDAGIALMGTDMGNIQLLNPRKQVLEIVAQRGFGPRFLEHYREVSAAHDTACGRSLRTGQRTIIEDVELDPEYAPHRASAAAAGYRAVLSKPIVDNEGATIGMFSVHFRHPHRPSELDLVRFDLYASQAAQFIERVRNHEQLQNLTRALLVTQEEANREIARELHDVFSQELVAVGMEIASVNKRGRAGQDALLSALSRKVEDLARRLHQTSRRIHPSILEDLGLEPALRQECEAFQGNYGIRVEFHADRLPSKIPLDIALCLYRVAQESLRNIHKHATRSGKVCVFLAGSPEGVTLTVMDQGDGFELEEATRKGGLGLISMEERVRAEGGRLAIQSKPGEGTTLAAFVPLEQAKADPKEGGQ